VKSWWRVAGFGLAAFLYACGSGGSPSSSSPSSSVAPAENVQPISVNPGPNGNGVNGLFTSVTLCSPGTSSCQTVNDVLVDTGSSGVRILASALTLSLPGETDASGNPIGECTPFVSSFTWGPVATADIKVSGETASNVPVQLIGSADFPEPPADCPNGLTPADTVSALGANGILGVGLFVQDCGSACAVSGASNAGFYYSCSSAGCVVTAQALQNQVANPVASLPVDNNGVLVDLPAVGGNGATTASGSLIFGIGTRSNNGLGSAQIYATDDLGNFTTVFDGNSYSSSFIDSGSNGLFFLSSSATGIGLCASDPGFYCPATTLSLSAQNEGQNGTSGTVKFGVANAEQLFSTGNAAFSNLGGPNTGAFDWGLPFFFGRNVFVAIDGATTPGGPGPYWAY
jgi:hypothetical protein